MRDGARCSVFVIAEAGSNWRMGTPERDLEMAYALIDVAAEAGADAVKFQTYKADTLYVADAGASRYLAEAGISKPINAIIKDLSMPYEMVPLLASRCEERGVEFMSSPFSVEDARAVDPFVKRHKVASYEINHVRLLRSLAETGKPVIISSGAADESDIRFGLETLYEAGCKDVTLLQCTSSYPAPMTGMNLLAIPYLSEKFSLPVGLSDHSRDPMVAPVAAVALGATVIEKHYTLHNRLPGVDHLFAILPEELAALVRAVREAEKALGDGKKGIQPAEEELRGFAVRALQATRDICTGEALREGVNFDVLRPGKRRRGLHPRQLEEVEGRVVARPITRGDGIRSEDLNGR